MECREDSIYEYEISSEESSDPKIEDRINAQYSYDPYAENDSSIRDILYHIDYITVIII